MKLTYFQLSMHLKKQLLPIYLITGNEPLLVQEAKNAIKQKAKDQGFLDIRHYETKKGFDWDQLLESVNTYSLFSDKSYIELRIEQKLNITASKVLTNFIEKINSNIMLILSMDKLESGIQKANWFQAMTKIGAIISIWPLELSQFKQWLKQKLQENQLSIDQFTIQYIIDQTEGNLLAASQEIEKLKLLFPSGHLVPEELVGNITDSARYDIFNLIDICLEGNLKKIIRVIKRLREEGTEPIVILWAFTREIRKLIHILNDIRNNISWEVITKKYQIWDKRQPLYKKIIKEHSVKSLHKLLLQAEKIDRNIKGLLPGCSWNALELLAIRFAGQELCL